MSEERKRIITVEQFRELARPTSIHLDESEVDIYIRESEDASIIPAVGYDVFLWLTTEQSESPAAAGKADKAILLDGGSYEDETRDNYGERVKVKRWCGGLRRATAYFAWARMQRADGNIITRAGAMTHTEDYGQHTGDEKLRQYNDAVDMAEKYLEEAMYYLKKQTGGAAPRPVKGKRATIKAIGD